MKRFLPFIVLLLLIVSSITAFADDGEFDFIVIKGPGITGELDVTNPALTQDFLAFADFTQGPIEPPADPGQGYQVVRMYVEGTKNHAFDMLHYYPYTGYVYYDAVADGSSEYVGKWYKANPAAEEPFRAALTTNARFTWIPFLALVLILGGFLFAYYRKPKQA